MPNQKLYYRSIFISDVHLGAAGCKSAQINDFLSSAHADYLYLVGDIIDGWVSRKSGKWNQAHTTVVSTILEKTKHGTIVRYTPGNHDAFLRKINGASLGNMVISDTFEHTTADGRRMLVVHGDIFDKSCTRMPTFAYLSAMVYEFFTVQNRRVNNLRGKLGREPVDYCSRMKTRLKAIVKRVTNFDEVLLQQAALGDYDGVICGHIHRPALYTDADGRVYANTGDWVEHCTVIVEHYNGELELLTWAELAGELMPATAHEGQFVI